jgi:D-alanyl-D-alanine carboxypeptidase
MMKLIFSLLVFFFGTMLTPLSEKASFRGTQQYLVPQAAIKVEKLITDAETAGLCLKIISSHRTFAYQQYLYDSIKDKTRVALPGSSEHELGTAVDFISCTDETADFATLPEYQWLKDNASSYGFTESYTKDNSAGFMYEPWHWNYKL